MEDRLGSPPEASKAGERSAAARLMRALLNLLGEPGEPPLGSVGTGVATARIGAQSEREGLNGGDIRTDLTIREGHCDGGNTCRYCLDRVAPVR